MCFEGEESNFDGAPQCAKNSPVDCFSVRGYSRHLHQSRASTRKSRSGLFFLFSLPHALIAGIYFVNTSTLLQASYRLRRLFFAKVTSRSFCCASFSPQKISLRDFLRGPRFPSPGRGRLVCALRVRSRTGRRTFFMNLFRIKMANNLDKMYPTRYTKL